MRPLQERWFSLIEEEFGVAKPDPRIFLSALTHLQIAANEAWMIGDDLLIDIAASEHIGIFALWFDPARKGLPAASPVQPNRIIHALSELLDLVKETSERRCGAVPHPLYDAQDEKNTLWSR